jgi:hypothetical protein
MQTVNHLPDKLNARSPAPDLGTSGGRGTVLRAHQGVAEGGQNSYAPMLWPVLTQQPNAYAPRSVPVYADWFQLPCLQPARGPL